MRTRILLLLFVLFTLSACDGLYSDNGSSNLIESIHLLRDNNSNHNFADIQGSKLEHQFISQKYTDRVSIKNGILASWLKIIVSAEVDPEKSYILELNRPTLEKVTVYIPKNNYQWNIVETGDSVLFNRREIPHENFLFKLSGSTLKTLKLPIYIKVQNHGTTSSSIKLVEEQDFYATDHHKLLLVGLYFGAVLGLVVYNLLLYLSVRDISYLWYVVYLGFIGFFSLAINGLTFRYLWPNNPYWANNSTYFFILMSMVAGLGFSQTMLNTKEFLPSLAKVMKWSNVIIVLTTFFGLFLGNAFFASVIPYFGLFVLLLILFAITIAIRANYKPAYFVSLGFLFLFLGGMMLILYKFELLPGTIFSVHGLQVGIILEAFILSFALAYRINYTNEKLNKANQALVDTNKKFSSKLIEFQDRERKETAETLHDSIGQKLLVTKIQLAQIFEQFNIPENNIRIKSVWGLIHEVINDVRDISHTLHPHQIERLTFKEALEDVINQSFKDTDMNYTYDFNSLEECIDKKSKLHVYRIIQELINNALKHSAAKNIEFKSFKTNSTLEIIVKDDGKGVPDQNWFKRKDYAKTYGLFNIMERIDSLSGSVNFISSRDQGFKTIILIPCVKGGLGHAK